MYERAYEFDVAHTISHDLKEEHSHDKSAELTYKHEALVKHNIGAKKADMAAVKKMIGLYVFGPPLTNAHDPVLK